MASAGIPLRGTKDPHENEPAQTDATDVTDKLRYFIGADNPPLIKGRREMTEENYLRFVRDTYYGGK